jgi:predicted nucleic acid-binding protein
VIVLDARVLIAHLDATDPHHERASALLNDAADEAIAASPITLAEVLVGPARAGKADHGAALLHDLGVTSVPLLEDAPVRLAMLRAGTGLKMPDCYVLLAAEQTHSALATFDDRLATSAAERGLALRAS